MRTGYVNDIFECARQTQAMKTEIPMTKKRQKERERGGKSREQKAVGERGLHHSQTRCQSHSLPLPPPHFNQRSHFAVKRPLG